MGTRFPVQPNSENHEIPVKVDEVHHADDDGFVTRDGRWTQSIETNVRGNSWITIDFHCFFDVFYE